MSQNWNVTKTEMSPKLKCQQNLILIQTELLFKTIMSAQQKFYQN